jgi:hypothetical protein
MTPGRKPLPKLVRCRQERAGLVRLLRAIRRAVQAEARAMGRRPRPRLVWVRPPN